MPLSTPPTSLEPSPSPTTPPELLNSLSDIFSSSPLLSPTTGPTTLQSSEPSDIPRLRATHTTSGYRDGVAAGKASSLQKGFDEGYSLGAVFGVRVGYILGVLEGMDAALKEGREEQREEIQGILKKARVELDLRMVFGKEFWCGDGTWAYEVVGDAGEGDVTFEEVAGAHPLVRRWEERLRELMEKWVVDIGRVKGEEWEKGRVGEVEGE